MSTARTEPVVVIDVGARWGAADTWRSLSPAVRVIGFDPDPAECERLNEVARAAGDDVATYVPVALGARHEIVDLYVTRQPACSSIYPPLTHLIERIPVLADIAPERSELVQLEPLDDWCRRNDVIRVDVLKVDTQGSELGVLQGAVSALANCVLVECEVEFNPIYQGQPLFADVDAFMREQGFVLWRLDNLMHYTDDDVMLSLDASVTINADARATRCRIGGGQLYWADAFFVRRSLIESPEDLTAAESEQAASIMRAAGLTDLAARIQPSLAAQLIAEARRSDRMRRQSRHAAADEPASAGAGPGEAISLAQRAAARARRTGARARRALMRRA